MAPSSTRMRSAARRRNSASIGEISITRPPSGARRFRAAAPCRARRTARSAARPGFAPVAWLYARYSAATHSSRRLLHGRAQAQQMADRVDQVGTVHGVEVKIGHAAIDEVEHLLGGDRGGYQLAGR